jgi:hypothetical protein
MRCLGRGVKGIVPHWVYDAAVPVGTALVGIVGLMIRNAILSSRVIVVQEIGKVAQAVAVHVAEDDVKHTDFDRRVTALERAR